MHSSDLLKKIFLPQVCKDTLCKADLIFAFALKCLINLQLIVIHCVKGPNLFFYIIVSCPNVL